MRLYITLVIMVFTPISFLWVDSAEAVPIFARKYTAPCTLCHSSWPKLNKVGWQFKFNGYQLPDENDGSKAGKVSPSFDLHLDIGNANPPIGLRLEGGLSIIQPKSSPDGNQSDRMACCAEANRLSLYAAGTIAKNTGYFIDFPFGDTAVRQAYIRFVNIYGQGVMALDLGAFRTADYDSITPGREWFSLPNLAFYGNGSVTGGDQGLTAGYQDSGIRFYGNPGYGKFSYELLYTAGSRSPGSASNGHGRSASFMGRIDLERFSGSFRYWNSESGEVDLWKDNSGNPYFIGQINEDVSSRDMVFLGDPVKPDEETLDYILALKYETAKWQTEFVYDYNVFKVGSRSRLDSTTGLTQVYSRGSVKRTGISLAGIYRVSSLITIGGRYGISSIDAYTETLDTTSAIVPGADVSLLELKVQFTPTQNARIGLQLTMDNSNSEARRFINGGVYSSQNELILQWDWAI